MTKRRVLRKIKESSTDCEIQEAVEGMILVAELEIVEFLSDKEPNNYLAEIHPLKVGIVEDDFINDKVTLWIDIYIKKIS